MSKTIVYLDHNFVSNLAKARVGGIGDAGLQRYYAQLFELLERLVLENRIACPRSTFHELEAELDGRLEREILLTIRSLARGVAFLDHTQVLNNQVTRALYKYLGGDRREPFAPWAEAFGEDPQAPVVRDWPPANPKTRAPGRPEKARWLKKRYVEEIRRVRQPRLARLPAFNVQLRREALSLADNYCFEPFLESQQAYEALLTGQKWDLRALLGAGHVYDLHRRYEDLTDDQSGQRFWQFFLSDGFASVPYVDIFCSLYAGSLVYSPERQPQEGDLYDMAMAATVLPYCDVLATDAHVNLLVRKLGLDVKYKVEVFSARKVDLPAFLTRLTTLVGV